MDITAEQIRAYRLHAHHLDARLPATAIVEAASACGLQNTPPGAWETALHNRLQGCTLQMLGDALHVHKTLLQAWSYRGVPVVFPTVQSDIFLTPLIAEEGEQPWIYTLGITGALEHMQMSFDDLLNRTKNAITHLDSHTIKSKEKLDSTLADIILGDLPAAKQSLWQNPSMYGHPDKQTVGGAVVSFLLRPCSFYSLVVFGERQGISPTFTSYKNWLGHMPEKTQQPGRELVRKFLHCFGPATKDSFMGWLGCSPRQARRLWQLVETKISPVRAGGKTAYILNDDMDALLTAEADQSNLLLLGAHDPYLDLKDRWVILSDKAKQKMVWRYVANPGAILRGGQVIGIWKVKTLKESLDISLSAWEGITAREERELERLAEEYAAFRMLKIRNFAIARV